MATQTNPRTLARPVPVVEDDRQIRDVIQWALEDAGLTVALAEDGAKAAEMAARQRAALVVLEST